MSANGKAWVNWTGEPTPQLIDERLRAGLAVLWRAYICAQDAGVNVWDLSLPTGRLYEEGMTNTDLRWLITKGYAEHRQEATFAEANRSLQGGTDHIRLVLTPNGAALAEQFFAQPSRFSQAALSTLSTVAHFANRRQSSDEVKTPAVKPVWDATRRELTVAGLIVKRFRVPARNQETILSVFEEEGWAEHIHDPLPLTLNIDAPTRLHDAINRLNRCQINSVLRFHGDGKGTGVFWGLNQPYVLP